MDRLLAIIGPTGIGKSRLAIHLAQAYNGEIVNADSRQVYRHMDIGTAKPTPEELASVPHHLVNILNPDEDFSLAQYQQLAYEAIEDIGRRHKLAILAGGSGQYVWSVVEGWGIPAVSPDPEFRHSLEETAATAGGDELYRELEEVDPAAAQRIDPRNIRRVIRALEVQRATKTPISRLQHKKALSPHTLMVGLTMDRTELYRRIDARVDEMLERGLIAEVEKLVNMGYNPDLPAMSGIGYRETGMFLRGEVTLAAAIQQIKFETHRFARHQYTWFHLKDSRIHWLDMQNGAGPEVTAPLAELIGGE